VPPPSIFSKTKIARPAARATGDLLA